MNYKRRKIGIDARLYGPLAKGLGRYTQELVDRIISFDRTNDYYIFLNEDNYDLVKIHPSFNNVHKVKINIAWYSVTEQIKLPFVLSKYKLDLIHFTHFNVPIFCPCKFVVTIHDLILTKFKSQKASTKHPLVYNIKDFCYRLVIKKALKNSEKVITVSNFTKDDIVSQFGICSDKIEVIYEGISFKDLKNINYDKESLLQKYGIKKDYFLYVGSAYPHKNLEFLIKEFIRFYKKNKSYQLVLVGKDDFFYERLESFARQALDDNEIVDSNAIVFTSYVKDNELAFFYKNASLYIFPSLYEGFGLPPLEALYYSCPVLSSNQASMPEILKKSALYFDPYSENDFLEKLELILRDGQLREKMLSYSQGLFADYDWDICAIKTQSIYLKLLS